MKNSVFNQYNNIIRLNGSVKMNEELIIKTCNEGISAVVSTVNGINTKLESVTQELMIIKSENKKLNRLPGSCL